jgi:hypothetical protein
LRLLDPGFLPCNPRFKFLSSPFTNLLSIRRQVGRHIHSLKRLYAKCSQENDPGKKRFAFYEYLYEVYAIHAHWRAQARVREIRRHIADLVQVRLRPTQHMVKLLIDASCTADHKTRSRWGQALRYVWQRCKRITMSRQEFNPFLHCNSGVAGCAAKSALPKMNAIQGRLGCGFDSLAFQKMIASEQSSSARGNVLRLDTE